MFSLCPYIGQKTTGSSAPGYVNLTDQLNEMREELEEKIDDQAQLMEELGERNQLRLGCRWTHVNSKGNFAGS